MPSGPEPVRVEGLREFQAELRKLDQKLPRELRVAGNEAAAIVVRDAQGRAQGRGGVAAKTAPSIKATSEQRGARVSLGGTRFPFAMGAEFGGRGRPTTQQFAPWTGSDSGAGYFFYPAIRETRDQVTDAYADALDRLMRDAFPN